MEEFLAQIEWLPTLVSFVLAFGLGWLWYSPTMFFEKWNAGKGGGLVEHPMWMSMFAQAGSTLFFAILINILAQNNNWAMIILATFTLSGFIKANGLFAGKTKFAIGVEASFTLVMAVAMVVVNMVL